MLAALTGSNTCRANSKLSKDLDSLPDVAEPPISLSPLLLQRRFRSLGYILLPSRICFVIFVSTATLVNNLTQCDPKIDRTFPNLEPVLEAASLTVFKSFTTQPAADPADTIN